MAALTAVSPARAANNFDGQAASAGGDTFANSGTEMLVVEHTNGAGADVDVTITTHKTVDTAELAVGDLVVTVPAGERHLLGPFPRGIYNDGDGNVSVGYSDETDIEVAVLKP